MHARTPRTVCAVLLCLAAACGRGDPSTAVVTPDPPPPPSAQDGLWTVSGSPSEIVRLDPGRLAGTGARDPDLALTTPSALLYKLNGVAFDQDGDLWIASSEDSRLLEFTPEVLTASGTRAASRVIVPVGGSLSEPTGLAFDDQGRLWVVNRTNATLVRYDAPQLAAGGAQVPSVKLLLPGNPNSIAFDAEGSLWVSDNHFNTIAKYSAAQIATSGSPGPLFRLVDANSLRNPGGIAFDSHGNLWVANTGVDEIVAFSAEQLVGIGPPYPLVRIEAAGGSLDVPVGLAFDDDGGLWIIGGGGTLTRYARSQLGTGGALTPDAQIAVSSHTLFWSIAFWPRPSGLPLH